jgi:TRAP-type C4-dicarboxylate transport system permease small subunit
LSAGVYRKIGSVYNKIEEYLLVSSLVFTVLLIFYQVIMRYVFNNSSFWSEELARYVFMWQIWMGASIGFKDDKHIRIEVFTSMLRGKVKVFFSLLSNLLVLVFCVFLVVKGWEFLKLTGRLNMVTPALRFSYIYVYASMPLSSLVVGLRMAGTVYGNLKMLFSSARQAEGGKA